MVMAAALALERRVQPLAALAHPPYTASRNSCHQGVVGNIVSDDGSGGYQGAAANRMATYDGAVGAQRGTLTDEGLGINAVDWEMGTRRGDIGEHAAGAAEHVVLDFNAFVDRHIVLDADAIADADIVGHVDILAQRTALAQAGSLLDMAEMPDLGACTYLHIVVDVAAFVNEVVFYHSKG